MLVYERRPGDVRVNESGTCGNAKGGATATVLNGETVSLYASLHTPLLTTLCITTEA